MPSLQARAFSFPRRWALGLLFLAEDERAGLGHRPVQERGGITWHHTPLGKGQCGPRGF